MEPCHHLIGLRVKNEFATFQAHCGLFGHAAALHDLLNVIQRQVYDGLLPDVAVLAARLASRGGVNHQLRQPFVVWTHHVVQIEVAIVGVVIKAVHILVRVSI